MCKKKVLLRQIRPQVTCSCREVLSLLSRLLQEPGGDRVNLQNENLPFEMLSLRISPAKGYNPSNKAR